ncbi:MAG: hypothetical protein CMN72_15805 [Sphingomonas sp.]|nr:hypothetical protein [Sphingomonas sp.]
MARNPRKALLRYFGTIGVIVALGCFGMPLFMDGATASDAQTLRSLGGTVMGVSLVLLVASFFVRQRPS